MGVSFAFEVDRTARLGRGCESKLPEPLHSMLAGCAGAGGGANHHTFEGSSSTREIEVLTY